MERRTFLVSGMAALSLMRSPQPSYAETRRASSNSTARHVRQLARSLAYRRYRPPPETLAAPLSELDYDGYREIQFRAEKAIWRNADLGFELQLFPSGYLYRTSVDIFLVENARMRRIEPTASLFDFGSRGLDAAAQATLGFSGFRIHAPLNKRDVYDEFLVFQGASYFRGVAKAQSYGLSARALALNTAGPEPEEFPFFRSFWIERPQTPDAITVHALLDSPSVTGAYSFVIRPGRETLVDTDAVLFPRRTLRNVGLAPLTSMFLKNAHDPAGPSDFRPSIHDSDGLAVWNGQDERLWRPLLSPPAFQASYFGDRDPKGFGLIQRERRFEDYQDLEAHYERRPSAWVAPKNKWGKGSVELVEIPTDVEYVDNIVAFWRPEGPLLPHRAYSYGYRLAWLDDTPEADLLRVHKTRIGTGSAPHRLRFVVDFSGGPGQSMAKVADSNAIVSDAPPIPVRDIDLTSSAGSLSNAVAQANPHLPGTRVAFELDPQGEKEIELRLALSTGDQRASETWLYRWSAG